MPDLGEGHSFPVYWSPTRASKQAVWSGAIREPLSEKVDGKQTNLRGVLGVFVASTVQAVFYSAIGEELSRETLQATDPREVVHLEKMVPLPAKAFRVSVRLLDAEGQKRGLPGNAILEPR